MLNYHHGTSSMLLEAVQSCNSLCLYPCAPPEGTLQFTSIYMLWPLSYYHLPCSSLIASVKYPTVTAGFLFVAATFSHNTFLENLCKETRLHLVHRVYNSRLIINIDPNMNDLLCYNTYPSIHPWIQNPYFESLSYWSTCQTWLGPCGLKNLMKVFYVQLPVATLLIYTLLLILCLALLRTPSGSICCKRNITVDLQIMCILL